MISKLEDENRVADEAFKELVGEFRQNICLMAGRMETHEAVCSDIHGTYVLPVWLSMSLRGAVDPAGQPGLGEGELGGGLRQPEELHAETDRS